MKKIIMRNAMFAFIVFCSARCGSDSKPKPSSIDPKDPNAISSVLIMPAGSTSSTGNPPAPSGASAPVITPQNTTKTSSNGGTIPIGFGYSHVTSNISGFYVQVVGTNSYYRIPFSGSIVTMIKSSSNFTF